MKLSAQQQDSIKQELLREGWYIVEHGLGTVFSKLGSTDYYVIEENRLQMGTIAHNKNKKLIEIPYSKFTKLQL